MRFGNADMTSEEDTINLVMSSSAMSGIFPYVKWRNTTFVDGASMKNFDPVGGI
jgi:predicted acylesterase/phospholipase RssA